MAGRKPKPTSLRIAEGNPGKRPLNEHEPQPRVRKPKPPAHLTERARTEWRRMLRLLWPTGVLTEAEADLLGLYCESYARFVEASAMVDVEGMIISSGNGTLMRHPALKVLNDERLFLGKCMSELGLTPSARVRLVAPKVDDNPLVRFLDGKS